ncbi:MAG: hypothetical protein EOO65_03785, partial [Methanosarcinales archaeon]
MPLNVKYRSFLAKLCEDPDVDELLKGVNKKSLEARVLWKASLSEPGLDEMLKVPRVTPATPLRDQVWAVNDADGSMVHLSASTLRARGGYFFVHIRDSS